MAVECEVKERDAARKELAEAKAALATWDTPTSMGLVELAKIIKGRVGELERIDEQNKAALEAAKSRIAELIVLNGEVGMIALEHQRTARDENARAERAEARIAELERANADLDVAPHLS